MSLLEKERSKMTKLKEVRIHGGYTQKQLAKEAGISERQYIRIENGERSTNVIVAYRIAKFLKTTIEDCFADILS